MEEYQTIGQLLKGYRKLNKYGQAEIAGHLQVDERTYRRWEKNQNQIADSNIKDLAELTKIPFEVLIRLNHDFPTLYNLQTRRYAHCPFDRDYVNKKILQKELFNTEEKGRISELRKSISDNRQQKFDFPIYPYKKRIRESLIKKTSMLLPELNLLIEDPLGFNSGHMICFPMKLEKYFELRDEKISEYEITETDLIKPQISEPISLHILSFFATNSTYVYCLIKRLVFFLLLNVNKNIHPESIISRYAMTKDGAELGRKMDLELARYGYDDFTNLNTEVVPHLFEKKVVNIEWIQNYKDKTIL